MKKLNTLQTFLIAALWPVLAPAVMAENSYSPHVDQNYPTTVFWGDTHVHTNLSYDSIGYGNETFGPEEAYRFAKGETLIAHNGMKVRLNRPLDFMVVADHATYMGITRSVMNGDLFKLDERQDKWRALYQDIQKIKGQGLEAISEVLADVAADPFFNAPKFKSFIWGDVIRSADKHNAPGQFTAFIGYEWTAPINLHRVVMFKDSAEKAGKILPLAAGYSPDADPEQLWAFMEDYENRTGGEVLAIPHNTNLSAGLAFALKTKAGKALTPQYAAQKNRWEPLLEVTQIKGDSETHPILSPTDEFADFETFNIERSYGADALQRQRKALRSQGIAYYDAWLDQQQEGSAAPRQTYEYARSGLKLGLAQQANLGINPFKFGLIGSTDSHTGLATAEENNFWGKMASAEPHKTRITAEWFPGQTTRVGWLMNAAGYAAVWAEENTREALFAAMKRKETYASTGPRMTLRFFGGWDYQPEDAYKPDLAKIGYQKGVPMGGDLTAAPKGKSPSFLIRAAKDPDGANLDRVQVIKGWRSRDGELHERIYNVTLSDGRKEKRDGNVNPVGSTVDIVDAAYTNTIGDPELATVWTDPDFKSEQLAFYYVRVLEIPTPRWTAYDAKFFNIKEMPDDVPMVTQERAYTSPIWYSP